MTEANAPAYPVSKERAEQYTDNPAFGFGLTKREYFAGLAMQALMSRGNHAIDKIDLKYRAEISVNAADALISELSKPQP